MSKFFNYLKAGYPVLWVETHEEDRCIAQLANEASMYDVYSWDIISGWKNLQKRESEQIVDNITIGNPVAPLNKVRDATKETSVVFLKDYHKFLPGVDTYRTLKNMINHLKAEDKHIVIVSPVTEIPVEMEKDVTVFEFDLPSQDDLMVIANRMINDNQLNIDVNQNAIAAAKGLTLNEAENAMALSIITSGTFTREILEDAKLQAVKKSGLMELSMPVPESDLGGLDNLKQYIHHRKRGFVESHLPTPRGILLAGLPGSGKSLSAKVTASVLGFPLLKLDIAGLKGSLVGESEKKMRQATQLADAIGECVIWVDEIEKALGGVQSSNKTDGGSTSGMFGHLLTWMQETESNVYIVATCNDIDDLLNISQGALLRRFDDIFFVDVPGLNERIQILDIMNARYGTQIDKEAMARAHNWTGAEIEKFVKASVFDGEDDAFNNIHPIFEQNKDNIHKARTWAMNNARPANVRIDESAVENKKVRRLQI
jgi:ATP-dependent 26S proteasome regulatory subunit